MEKIEDKDLGTILIKRNARAKRVIARRKGDVFVLTVPAFLSIKNIEAAFSQLKPKLIHLPTPDKFQFVDGRQLQTLTFDVNIERGSLDNIYYRLHDGTLKIILAKDSELEADETQDSIQWIVEAHLRHEAKLLLTKLVKQLADKHKFKYTSVSIQKSRTRWGSCSSTKKINLAYWCMLLPMHLIELVILHELCHTIEMNHSSRFWALLDQVAEGKADSLTLELKNTKIPL